ncbi:MAG: EAL domain-containing protein [Desulfopila sp.]|jgi:diguanylate cyclase (GGDEF)-like protein/PAS domain S-box-containing protein|nr:EAL domain-containing protein [Desulfopila sp.]
MGKLKRVNGIRLRYVLGLSVIAILITASFITMQKVVSDQRDFSSLVNLAGHQAGLSNRIAYFSSLMATTADEAEFEMARAQVGRTINKMKAAHTILRNGDPEKGIPLVTNDNLITIYEDPMVGLDNALLSFLERAQTLYDTAISDLHTGSAAYIYLTTYGPHVLEPMLDAAVEEYGNIGREAILRIERLEAAIWLATIITLILEVCFIFVPLEHHIHRSFASLQSSITALTNTRQRLLAAQKLALVGDWELVVDEGRLTWSDQVYEICGVSPENFTVSLDSAMELIHPEDRALVRTTLQRSTIKKKPLQMEYRIVRPDGNVRLVYQQAEVYTKETDNAVMISGIIQDITERKELSARLEKLSEHIPGFLFQYHLSPEGSIRFPFVSQGIENTCGIKREQLDADPETMFNLVHIDDRLKLRQPFLMPGEVQQDWHDKYRFIHPHTGEIWLEGHASAERLNDGSMLWYGYIWDITESKRSEDRIKQLALYDPLTGLANRRLLKDRILHAIATSRRNSNYGAVIMLDLDNFKTLNDTKGHNVGDALLVEVAARLQGCVRETDTIARLGGDEFVVILEWLGKTEETSRRKALDVAEKIRVALSRTYVLEAGSHVHHASASIGVTLFQDNRLSEGELLKRADVAMYEAKDYGRNRVCLYNEERQSVINRRTAMASAMQQALENDEFSLFFQPQISADGSICGAEALLRWFPPGKEPVMPGDFIPVAEDTNFIQPLGEWVLQEACRCISALDGFVLPDSFAIAVNISARQFSEECFVDKVRSLISENAVNVRRLKFELTESCLVQDLDRGHVILSALREMGIHMELDDFGTGYSSLHALNNLPLSTLKIDGSLIHGLEEEPRGKAIVRAAIAMAKAMALNIVAECVETEQQKDFLIEEGCDMLQGFLFARPMSFADFERYLRTELPLSTQSSDSNEIADVAWIN